MGLRLLYKRIILILAGMAVSLSCEKEVANSNSIRIQAEAMGTATKTLLESDGIEDKITSTVLAAYTKGKLYRTAYFTGDGTSLPLTLENGQVYTVYALINTGDTRSSFPQYESGIGNITYRLTSYDSGSDCVNSRGIPMAGWTSVTGGDGLSTIGVKRLLAKVTANIQCDWPGGTVTGGIVCNMNSVLKPFGTSAMESPTDSFTFNPERHNCAPVNSSATLVFYVPENMQGTIAGIESSSDKSHEHNAAVNSKKDCLTYLEVSVSGSGLYEGDIVYRSYLGRNSTDNFDIIRNCSYVWNITYSEDNLAHDDWKMDNSLDDKRELSVPGALYLIPGEDVSLAEHVSTNMPLETIGWQMGPNQIGSDLVGTIHNEDNLAGLSFSTDDENTPDSYGNRVIGIFPLSNPRTGLGGNIRVYIVDELSAWKNTLTGPVYDMVTHNPGSGNKYFVSPGKTTNAQVDFTVFYNDDEIREHVETRLLGKGGSRWSFTDSPYQGISGQLIGDVGDEYDVIKYTAGSTVLPGDYPIKAQAMDGSSSDAYIHVNDTRVLRWVNRSSVVPGTSDGVIFYKYLSENKILIHLNSGSAYVTSGGTTFTQNNSPFQFTASDRSMKSSALPSGYIGTPFEGGALHAGNYTGKISISYSGTLATNGVFNTQIGNKTSSGLLTLVPRVTANLSDSGRHVITIKAKNGYDDNTTHAIEAIVMAKNGTYSELALTPAISRVTVGATVTLTATRYSFRVTNNNLMTDNSTVLHGTNSNLTWTGAPNGVFTATHPGNYRITATYTGGLTAYADIEVTASDVDVSGEWEIGGSIILD